MVAARRALDEPGLPPLALRLPVAHRARARGREPACRGDVPAARLHRRVDRERRARHAARARAQLHDRAALPEHGAGADHAAAAISHRRAARAAGPHARPRAAHRRGERHRFLRARRQRDHRCDRRARAVRAQRDPVGGGRRQRAHAQPAARFRQAARRAEADGRRRPRRASCSSPTAIRRCAPTAALAPAGRRASTCIRRSSSTASGCARSPISSARASCRSSRRSRNAPAGASCANPATDRFTFVDAHQQAFAGHGVCARSEQDPEFDRACFLADGKSFAASPVEGATEPLTCGQPVAEFRAYAPRARWIRTANDSYFVAMTYPEGLPLTQQPSDIHDATWGVISAVYGGAVHPTAEGHAAMADAALAGVARSVLGLAAQATVTVTPLGPLNTDAAMTARALMSNDRTRRPTTHARCRRGRLQEGDHQAAELPPAEARHSGRQGDGLAAPRSRRAGSFPGGGARLAGPDQRRAADLCRRPHDAPERARQRHAAAVDDGQNDGDGAACLHPATRLRGFNPSRCAPACRSPHRSCCAAPGGRARGCFGDCIAKTTNMFSFGSTQK